MLDASIPLLLEASQACQCLNVSRACCQILHVSKTIALAAVRLPSSRICCHQSSSTLGCRCRRRCGFESRGWLMQKEVAGGGCCKMEVAGGGWCKRMWQGGAGVKGGGPVHCFSEATLLYSSSVSWLIWGKCMISNITVALSQYLWVGRLRLVVCVARGSPS